MAEQAYDINELVKQIVKNHALPERIAARKASEEEARTLIITNLGNLTQENLSQIFKSVDRDFWGGQLKQGRFGLTFQGANGKSICEQVNETNKWINDFWMAPVEECFDLVGRFMKEKPIRNAGYGFPSLILYLRDPKAFNIWINVMISAFEYIEGKSYVGSSGEDYKNYNSSVNEFRDKFQLEPGEPCGQTCCPYSCCSYPTGFNQNYFVTFPLSQCH